ncbi:MAG TPA: helix-turn-helix domain-containing protein [Chloroflexota bacterium]|nr:helix-turn-helix domain-containing protein [Chloroflexota bacterium]
MQLMQRTRRAILDYLKRKPGATLEELAGAGGIAPITARAHVGVLIEHGLLRATDVRGRRGRPFRRYFLTDAADAYFPKHYDRLALGLLSGLSQLEGQEAVQALVDHVAAAMAAGYESRVAGKPLKERVATIAEMIEEQGGAADWEVTDSAYVIHERNCPYLSVSRCNDHVCEIDRQVVARLAGSPVEVPQRLRDGDESCDFVIAKSEPDPKVRPAPGK